MPELIRFRRYEFNNANILQHWRKNSLTHYIVQTLPNKALRDWFYFASEDDEDDEPISEMKDLEQLQKEYKLKENTLKVAHGSRAFGLSLLNYDNTVNRFQVIHGNKIIKARNDKFGDLESLKVSLPRNQSAQLDMDFVRPLRRYFPDEAKGLSYIEPIWDQLVFIYWITFSMAEGAAAEGSKFLTIGVKDPKKGTIARLQNKIIGVSQRKAFVHNIDLVPSDAIDVKDTKLTATFHDYLVACHEQISLYITVPISILLGVASGKMEYGAEMDLGGEYEAYGIIQQEMEPYLREVFKGEPFFFDTDGYKFIWNKKQRLTDKEQAEIELFKAQAAVQKLNFMTEMEIRKKDYGITEPLPADFNRMFASFNRALDAKEEPVNAES
jgi:hypothetical protein